MKQAKDAVKQKAKADAIARYNQDKGFSGMVSLFEKQEKSLSKVKPLKIRKQRVVKEPIRNEESKVEEKKEKKIRKPRGEGKKTIARKEREALIANASATNPAGIVTTHY